MGRVSNDSSAIRSLMPNYAEKTKKLRTNPTYSFPPATKMLVPKPAHVTCVANLSSFFLASGSTEDM